MRPRHSDVFEEYVKIALEKGLISDEKETKTSPKKEEKKELSNAEIFYGVSDKSNLDLMHEAHPKTIVMGPSYDKFNGVVENLEQRSNIMQFIALKNPQILQTNTRYIKARQDLVNETIKLGFYLDNKNQESLMKLADACTEQLSKEADWKSVILKMLGLGAAAAVGASIAAEYYPGSQGFKNDCKRLLIEIEEAVKDYPDLGTKVASFVRLVSEANDCSQNLDSLLAPITNEHIQISSIKDKKEKNEALKKLGQRIKSSGDLQNIKNTASKLKEYIDEFVETAPTIIEQMQKAPEKYEEATSTIWYNIKKVFRAGVLPDTEDVVKHIQSMTKSSLEYKTKIDESLDEVLALTKIPSLVTQKKSKKSEDKFNQGKPLSDEDKKLMNFSLEDIKL